MKKLTKYLLLIVCLTFLTCQMEITKDVAKGKTNLLHSKRTSGAGVTFLVKTHSNFDKTLFENSDFEVVGCYDLESFKWWKVRSSDLTINEKTVLKGLS